jgi:hypothetical protein
MSFRLLNFKKPDTTLTGAIPELNGLGLIKVKDTAGQLQNVTSLYVNDGTATPKLIWEPTTVSPSTNESTQPPVGPCDNQPTCPNPLESVHYPLIPGTTSRWDCSLWKTCANAVDLQLNTTISSNSALLDPTTNTPYAKVYNFAGPAPLPPPPGYVVLDYVSFTVADRVAVYINKNIESTAANFNSLTANDPNSQVLFPSRTTAFNQGHGYLSQVPYSLACDCLPSSDCTSNSFSLNTPALPLCLLDPAGAFTICSCNSTTCGSSCDCIGTTIASVGGGQQQCRTLNELDNQYTTFIIDTSCIATTEGCKTVCYGRPAQSTAGDVSPSGGYACRFVGKVPNIVTGSDILSNDFGSTFSFPSSVYNRALELKDFAIVNDAGCRFPEDCPAATLPPCPSAWKVKVFLPFYVNLPDAKYPSGTGLSSGALTDATSVLNLKGKYIEILNDTIDVDLVDAYKNYPILKTVQNLLLGHIRSCSTILSFPFDSNTGSTSANTTFWSITEWPRQINASTPSHTHQVVLEFTNPAADTCGLCINGNGINSSKSAFIRFYPICDNNGVLYPYFADFAKALYANPSSTTISSSINDVVYSIRQQYHPILGQNSIGTLFHNNATLFTEGTTGTDAGNPQFGIYKEIVINSTTSAEFNLKGDTITNTNLQLTPTLNKIQQLPITLSQSTDCQCTPI